MVILQIGDPVVCHLHLLLKSVRPLDDLIVLVDPLFQLLQPMIGQPVGRQDSAQRPYQRPNHRQQRHDYFRSHTYDASASLVFGPTMPSTDSPDARWKRSTAALVLAPYWPSIPVLPMLYPRRLSSYCTQRIPSPQSPR